MLEAYGYIIDGDSMAANITSDVFDVKDCTTVAVQFTAASATHVGTVAVQGSNDNTNFNAITLDSTPTAASGSAFNALVNLADVGYRYLRCVYTAGSGAGTLYAYATGK